MELNILFISYTFIILYSLYCIVTDSLLSNMTYSVSNKMIAVRFKISIN